MRAGSPAEVARITDALHVLLSRGDAAIDRLATAVGATDLIRTDGAYSTCTRIRRLRRRRATRWPRATGEAPLPEVRDRRSGSRHRSGASGNGDLRVPQAGGAVRAQPGLELTTKGRGRNFTAARRRPRARRGRPARGSGGTLSPSAYCRKRELRGGQGRHRGRGLVAGACGAQLGDPPAGGARARLPRDAAARAGVGLKAAVHYGDRLISMTPMIGWTPCIERRGACGRGCGAELGRAATWSSKGAEIVVPGSGRHRRHPLDGSPSRRHRTRCRSSERIRPIPTSCSPPGMAPWGSPSRRSRRRSSATLQQEGSPTSTWRRTGRIVSDFGVRTAIPDPSLAWGALRRREHSAARARRCRTRHRYRTRAVRVHAGRGGPAIDGPTRRCLPGCISAPGGVRIDADGARRTVTLERGVDYAPIANISSRSCRE